MDNTKRIVSISRKIDEMINKLVSDILIVYRDKLLFEDSTYIIPAVWGAVKNGALDKTQKEINKKIKKITEKVISTMDIAKLLDPQKFAVQYLINRTIISSITYLIEIGKSQLAGNTTSNKDLIKNLKPMGNA